MMSPADVRLDRRIRADARGRELTSQERATLSRIRGITDSPWDPYDRRRRATREVPSGPLAMLPVAQLYARDVPCLRPPVGTDLLQVLWCPYAHGYEAALRTRLFWRASGEVTDVIADPPEPALVQSEYFVPNACRLHPENVTEYPRQEYTRQPVEGIDSTLREALDERYQYRYTSDLATAPGCKVGGWTPWDRTDAVAVRCTACDAPMDPLLTIASREWGGGSYSWIPLEDRTEDGGDPEAFEATGLTLGDADSQQLFVCSADPTHPHTARLL
ncbi:hypothetical protein [Nocardia tenerifensis]|nr:hypothetical protein [Nocardia tenerifensis]